MSLKNFFTNNEKWFIISEYYKKTTESINKIIISLENLDIFYKNFFFFLNIIMINFKIIFYYFILEIKKKEIVYMQI